MKITAFSKKIEDDQIRLDIKFPPEKLEEQFDTLAKKYAVKVKLPGFREGKVPLHIVKTRFKDTIRSEALEKVLPEIISEAVKKESLEVYGPPVLNLDKNGKSPFETISSDSFDSTKPIEFSVNFSLPPEAKIKSISSVVLRDHRIEIVPAELEEEIERETLPFTTLEEVKDAPQYKDLIKADIVFQDAAFEKYTLREHNFMYSSPENGARPAYLDDLREILLAMPAGTTRRETITFTAASEEKTLEGVTTDVELKVLLVKRRGKVVFDEKMLKNLNVASEAEYRSAVQKRLGELGEKLVERVHVQEILETLRKTAKFRVPSLVMDNYIKHEWEQYQNQFSYYLQQQLQGTEEAQIKKMIEQSLPKEPGEEWLKSAREKGAKALREMLIFQELKKLHPAEVEEAQINDHLTKVAQQYGKTDIALFRKELIQSGEFSRLKDQLSEETTWKTVIKNCKHKKGTPHSIKALEKLLSEGGAAP